MQELSHNSLQRKVTQYLGLSYVSHESMVQHNGLLVGDKPVGGWTGLSLGISLS